MKESYIGPIQTEVNLLRKQGVTIPNDVVSVSVEISQTDRNITGTQTIVQKDLNGAKVTNVFKTVAVSGPLAAQLKQYVLTPGFTQLHNNLFGVDPGDSYQPKSALDILTEAKASPQWPEIEAEMLVSGSKLVDIAPAYGIKVYEQI